MQIKERTCQVKTTGDDKALGEGEFKAYPSTFTRMPDAYGDVVAKGAFADTIKAWKDSGKTLPVMYGHRMDDPDYNVAGVEDMGEDDHGWWIKGRFDMDSPKAAQVYRLIKDGRLSQLSFAFDVLDEGTVELDDGTEANELRKLDVYEASFVPVGANQDTSIVGIKAAGMKAGRVLSAKNASMLQEVADSLNKSATKIKDFLAQAAPDQDSNNQSEDAKADAGQVKTEEPHRAKAEERKPDADSQALKLAIDIALTGEGSEVA
ncbi:putative phage prohead protease [Bifidobacterium actinocoloniiforme DSM 22766]|uniref:Putative phage prohead protease n=1 Tax=Bifidobacterium actinocoloniiforme DSM 22766 TaxID=1437605 RepID=A0A086Z1H2_9BIFI|nr:HK97 family phage prohead protease [Bifidobacterium actinocoloniiforme]AKV55513.1 hypothetical protein AB656_03995 [Bifidobacterium actinocoloniiforme DSM 22766]KFI40372.1 putative phage prohead protease [Bifidobacterium actinocoloniiforme DSM 22766]